MTGPGHCGGCLQLLGCSGSSRSMGDGPESLQPTPSKPRGDLGVRASVYHHDGPGPGAAEGLGERLNVNAIRSHRVSLSDSFQGHFPRSTRAAISPDVSSSSSPSSQSESLRLGGSDEKSLSTSSSIIATTPVIFLSPSPSSEPPPSPASAGP
eukprot:CAMPEP_0181297654 /NCGR_PEP_ID=MMETSP1101-20121128/5358_1 /TAXON_ID=46948 /ORGANISM="Rhodomonas abbreviata, Strain Caron Lab Isolate" /LENGTH=152 /DNA_ID=CAMNT_0023402611 /DNA_START=317 /DNA_END=772 /DNA_ORIENTATION=-